VETAAAGIGPLSRLCRRSPTAARRHNRAQILIVGGLYSEIALPKSTEIALPKRVEEEEEEEEFFNHQHATETRKAAPPFDPLLLLLLLLLLYPHYEPLCAINDLSEARLGGLLFTGRITQRSDLACSRGPHGDI
jgi:hypothetical protein